MCRVLLSSFVLLAYVVIVGSASASALATGDEVRIEPGNKVPVLLTLPDALSRVTEKSPRLKSADLGVQAVEAEVTQAWVIPNPELSYDTENYDGSGPYAGGALREDTISLSQRIEIGGKWGDRIKVAETNASAARIDGELVMQGVTTETVSLFATALANQLRMQTAKEIFGLTKNLAEAAKARVEAGKEPPYFAMNANATLYSAKADYERAKNEFILSRRRLAALWGESKLSFDRLSGNLESIGRPPAQEKVMASLGSYPLARKNALILKHAEAESELQNGLRWPDLTLTVGERKLQESDERSYVAGVSVVMPLFDRNQGASRSAEIRYRQAEEESRIAELNLRLEIENNLSGLWTSYHELGYYRHAGLAAGQEAMKAATEGYREGKLTYVEALDARRALAEVQNRYIDTLERYHTSRARLYELTGQAVEVAGGWLTEWSDK